MSFNYYEEDCQLGFNERLPQQAILPQSAGFSGNYDLLNFYPTQQDDNNDK